MNPATPEEVCRAVSLDLRARGITQQQAAERIGKSRAIISNLLSSKKRFSKAMADLFCREFGYNIGYLLYGTGELRAKQIVHDIIELPSTGSNGNPTEDMFILGSMISIAEDILAIIDDKYALGAWEALKNGDFPGYKHNMVRLSASHNKAYSPILARFVCERITSKMYLPIVEDVEDSDKN